MSILENLYTGRINPSEKYIKKGGEYQRINDKLCENIDELLKLINNNEKEICDKIENQISELNYIIEKESFIEGFILGAKIILEIYSYKNEYFL